MTADHASDAAQEFDGVGKAIPLDVAAAQYGIDGVVPTALIQPADLDELSRSMEAAHHHDMAVAPWGGGTRVSLGNIPERLDAVVDVSRLNRVVSHNPADLTATVQAGITMAALQRILGEHRQFLALDPPLPQRATVGGTLATAVSGPLKWQYGSPRDLVIGMKVVQADGKVTKSGGQVVKNVSGYDMSRLHIGGLGTLGVIAEASFKLTPLPSHQATVVAAYEASGPCVAAGLDVFRSDFLPLALVCFDRAANDRMRATELDGGGFLAIRLGGRPRTLERLVKEARSISRRHEPTHVEVLPEAESVDVWAKIADFGWDDQTTPVMSSRALIQPSQVAELTEVLENWHLEAGLHPAVVSQPAHGTVLTGWFAEETPPIDQITGLVRRLRQAVHALDGKVVIERCPTEAKSGLNVWDDPGPAVAIMRRLKEQYDPGRILNPGRFAKGI